MFYRLVLKARTRVSERPAEFLSIYETRHYETKDVNKQKIINFVFNRFDPGNLIMDDIKQYM